MKPIVRAAYRAAWVMRRAYWAAFAPITLGVRAAVFDETGRILLVRHTYRPGWYLPGGGVERRETIRDALVRELDEEVGVTMAEEPALFGVYTNFFENKSDHVALFRVGRYAITPRPNLEIAEQGFFAMDAPPADSSPGTLRRLAELQGHAPIGHMW